MKALPDMNKLPSKIDPGSGEKKVWKIREGYNGCAFRVHLATATGVICMCVQGILTRAHLSLVFGLPHSQRRHWLLTAFPQCASCSSKVKQSGRQKLCSSFKALYWKMKSIWRHLLEIISHQKGEVLAHLQNDGCFWLSFLAGEQWWK